MSQSAYTLSPLAVVTEFGKLFSPDAKYENKSVLLLYVEDELTVTPLLIPYQVYPDYFLLALSANGLMVNANCNNYDADVVQFVCDLSTALYDYLKKEPTDYRNYLEEYPFLNCCLLPSEATAPQLDTPDYENSKTYVQEKTFHYLSQCAFV